jgi:hypothetical protein
LRPCRAHAAACGAQPSGNHPPIAATRRSSKPSCSHMAPMWTTPCPHHHMACHTTCRLETHLVGWYIHAASAVGVAMQTTLVNQERTGYNKVVTAERHWRVWYAMKQEQTWMRQAMLPCAEQEELTPSRCTTSCRPCNQHYGGCQPSKQQHLQQLPIGVHRSSAHPSAQLCGKLLTRTMPCTAYFMQHYMSSTVQYACPLILNIPVAPSHPPTLPPPPPPPRPPRLWQSAAARM